MLKDYVNIYDFKFDVRHDHLTDKFKIGNAQLDFDEDLVINKIRYEMTSGLYELILKKHPIRFNNSDENIYRDILKRTCAGRRNYNPTEQIEGNRSWKYQNIIAPVRSCISFKPRSFSIANPSSFGGSGVSGDGDLLIDANNKSIVYIHWDNPNELVDRLCLFAKFMC